LIGDLAMPFGLRDKGDGTAFDRQWAIFRWRSGGFLKLAWNVSAVRAGYLVNTGLRLRSPGYIQPPKP
jgi:hypothetical protein